MDIEIQKKTYMIEHNKFCNVAISNFEFDVEDKFKSSVQIILIGCVEIYSSAFLLNLSLRICFFIFSVKYCCPEV